jgi:hypothetical protein
MPYKDREKQKAYQVAWFQANKERLRPKHTAQSKAWKLANPERNKAHREKHRDKKAMEKAMLYEHGTYTRYVKGKCRCEPCSLANREYQRDWHRKRYGLTPEQKEAKKAASKARKEVRLRAKRVARYEFDGEHNVCACGAKLIADITPEQWEAHKALRHNLAKSVTVE